MVNKLDKWFYKGTNCQNSSMVERSTCNADVVGSSPASGFDIWCSLVS